MGKKKNSTEPDATSGSNHSLPADSNICAPLTFEDIESAYLRIREVLPPTPLTFSPILSEICGRDIFVKWDNRQRTGSFKERGAVNVLAHLTAEQRARGVCAASAGNHALALSYHAARSHVPCVIVMPIGAPLVKVQATRATGAEVILFGSTFDEAYEHALSLAHERGAEFISAFDDIRVIAGQASAGMEILDQIESFDSVVVPIGGGGLASGIAAALKHERPATFVMGVASQWAVDMRNSSHAPSSRKFSPATIADGIAVKRVGAITGPMVKRLVDHVVTVSEAQIARAIIVLLETERVVAEGAGAAGLAGLLSHQLPSTCTRTVLLVCGSNIDMSLLARLIEREMAERGRLLRMQVSVPDRPGLLHALSGIIASCGANVVQVYHDRSLSIQPGNVAITFRVEVRDSSHRDEVTGALRDAGVELRIL